MARCSVWRARLRRGRRRPGRWARGSPTRAPGGTPTLCLVASGLAPRTVGGTLTGRVLLDGEDATPLAMHELAGRVGIAFASPATPPSGVAAPGHAAAAVAAP